MGDPDFTNMSKAELKHYMGNYPSNSPLYRAALSALSKKEKIEDDETASQVSKTIFWSRIAAIAAIVGVFLTALQILFSIYPSTIQRESLKPSVPQIKQDMQSSSNSLASSISSSNTKTSSTPHTKKNDLRHKAAKEKNRNQ